MAYKSLYRKYRPSKFEDVCGQKYIVNTLYNAIANNKISHAYLFCGTRGTGKTTIAKIFAKMVNCINMKDNKPCGECEICNCENTDEIPDIIEIDAASNNGVDEIRELKNKIKLMPVSCKYKVYIIDEVHMLSTGAFNALLKTLEEPPSHVIFILATTEPQKLPITIISRCQRFDFKRINVDDAVNRLKLIAKEEKIKITDDALIEIAKLSDGAMRDAIGLLDQLSSYSESISIDDIYTLKGSVPTKTLFDLINSYLENDIEKMLDIIEQLYNDGKNFQLLVEDMLNVFRNLLICRKASKYFNKVDFQNKEEIKKLEKYIGENDIEKIILKLENLTHEMKNSNYARILFETTLLSCLNDDDNKLKEERSSDTNIKNNVVSLNTEQKIQKNNTKDNILVDEVINTKKTDNNMETKVLQEQKKILINNTICEATSADKKKINLAFESLDNYLIDKNFKLSASILKDSIVTAASENHVLLTYKYLSMIDEFDNQLNNIENLLENMLGKKYKVVAISEDEWKKERPYYLDLKKQNKLKLLEEINTSDINEKKDLEVEKYEEIFGNDILEMEG